MKSLKTFKSTTKILIIIGFVFLAMASTYYSLFSGKGSAKEFLEKQGYTDVTVNFGNFFACSKNERSTSFKAMSPIGENVTGNVCDPLYLKPSIRLD